MAARVAATVDRIPPPAARISRYPAPRWRSSHSPSREPANSRWVCGSTSPGVTVPPRGIEPGEPPERVALGLERAFDGRSRPDGGDAALPAGDDRGIRGRRARRHRPPEADDVVLALAHPDAAREGDDLGRADDQEAGRRLVAATALDDPEAAASHRALRGPDPGVARAASSRSSSACIGEKSRRRR